MYMTSGITVEISALLPSWIDISLNIDLSGFFKYRNTFL